MADPAATRLPLTQRLRTWQYTLMDVVAALIFVSGVRQQSDSHKTTYQNHGLDLLILGMTIVFPFRRRFPLPTLLLLVVGTTTLTFFPEPYSSYQPFAMMFALYSVVATCSARVAIVATAGMTALAISIMLSLGNGPAMAILSGCAVALAPGAAGYSVRERRAYTASIAQEQARLTEAEVTSRLAAERIRIARELHDVVAHALSLMTVQAGVAVFRNHETEQLRETLASIEETGRAALVDMRQLLGVLRAGEGGVGDPGRRAIAEAAPAKPGAQGSGTGSQPPGGPADVAAVAEPAPLDLAPVPALAGLADLVTQISQAGLRVTLRVDGDPRPLPAGIELAAYRIVQESLTNVLRHAGTPVCSVRVAYGTDAVAVTVTNGAPPDGLPSRPAGPPGHGMAGMAERAALFGGTFTAGPAPGGGFRASARFPA